MRWQRSPGQHMTEFALVIGIASIAAIFMQRFVSRAVLTGLRSVSDTVLEPPVNTAVNNSTNSTNVSSYNVDAKSAVDELGDATFHRNTRVRERVTGNSLNESTHLQVFTE